MFDRRFLLLASIGGLIVAGHYAQLQANEPKIQVEVLHCHDGDTCRVKIEGAVWVNVRLAGIDAPEIKGRGKKGQARADEAKEYVTKHLKGKKVSMRQTDLDRYNRPVVEFYLEDKPFNLDLIKAGLAEAYRGKTKRMDKSAYISAEEEAQKAKRGIWSDPTYQSPSDYRKK